MIWLRVGDSGEWESFDHLLDAIDYMNELNVGQVQVWINTGVETVNYWGRDHISLYHGDAERNLVSNLLPDERVLVGDKLQECYL